MRSTRSRLALAAFLPTLLLSACASTQPETPRFPELGTRTREYGSLADLAAASSAVVIAKPTGKVKEVPLPNSVRSAPTPFVTLTVTRVLSGSVSETTIQFVSPGLDTSGHLGLVDGGPYLLFVQPAVYGPSQPAGGYVATGGPAGVFASSDNGRSFAKTDEGSPLLPSRIDLRGSALPAAGRAEEQIIKMGK